jgi:hypothetical protein
MMRFLIVLLCLVSSGCAQMIEKQKEHDRLYQERFSILLRHDPVFNRHEGLYQSVEEHEKRIRELEHQLEALKGD